MLAGLVFAGCNNFDTAYDDCVSRGACTDRPDSGGSTGGGGGAMGGGGGETGGGSGPTGGGATGGGGPSSVMIDRTDVAFGALALFETSAPSSVRIANTGTQAVAVELELSGTHVFDFSLQHNCPMSLRAGSDCVAQLRFTPSNPVGLKTAFLRVIADATSMLSLSGEAIAPLTIAPSPLDFGGTNVGDLSFLLVDVTNNTSGILSQTRLIQPAGPFTSAADCADIPARSTCSYAVNFAPTDAGVFNASLSTQVTVNGNTFTPPAVPLQGTGVARGSLSLGMDPFNNVRVDAGTPIVRAFTLTSISPTPTTYGLSLGGSGAAAFSIVDAGCGTIPGNSSCSGLVQFRPTGDGSFSATLAADGGLAGFAFLSMSARGFEAGRLQWVDDGGTVWPTTNQDVTRTFTLRNASTGPCPAVFVTLADAGTYGFELEPDAGVGGCLSGVTALPPSGSCTVKVTFKAGTDLTPSGLSTATLRASASGASPATAALSATASYTMMPGPHFGFPQSFTLVTGSPTRGCDFRGDGEYQFIASAPGGTQLEFKRESSLDATRCTNGQYFWEIPTRASAGYPGLIRACNGATTYPSGEGAGTTIGAGTNSFCLNSSYNPPIWGSDQAGSGQNACRLMLDRIGRLWTCR